MGVDECARITAGRENTLCAKNAFCFHDALKTTLSYLQTLLMKPRFFSFLALAATAGALSLLTGCTDMPQVGGGG